MAKLTEEYIIEKKFTTGSFLPLPGAIYMGMIIIFKQLFSKPIKAKLYVEPSWKEGM